MSDTREKRLSEHTCSGSAGRAGCSPCMAFEADLWDAINRYAVACGGDPGSHVYGNTARMQAVADVGKIVDRSAYAVAQELAQLWRDQRTASFDLLDRLAAHFDPGGKT